ncbi:MAG: hypothetical protein HC779_00275 [Phyllobacteriaceae bacterium]|nr:hypothetical protein [Phyllobacteriaceae bacterium]
MAIIGAAVACLTVSGCTDDVYSNLDQRQANDVIAVLAENGIKAWRNGTDDVYAVTIAADDISEAALILKRAGLPRQNYQTVTDLFPGDSMIVTPFEQEARMAFALGQELSKPSSRLQGSAKPMCMWFCPSVTFATGWSRNPARRSPCTSIQQPTQVC